MQYATSKVLGAILVATLVSGPCQALSQTKSYAASSSQTVIEQPSIRCENCDGGVDPNPAPPGSGGGTGAAQPIVNFFNVDPQRGLIEAELSNGLVMIIDERLGTIDISTPSGSVTVPLDAAILKWTNGNAASAAAVRASFHAALQGPQNTAMLWRSSNAAELTSGSPRIMQERAFMSGRSNTTSSLIMGPIGGRGFECSFSWACNIIQTNYIGRPDYNFGGWYTTTAGSGSASDRRAWERRRDDACSDKYIDGGLAAGALLGTVAMCATTPFGGLTALGCAGGAIGYAAASVSFTKNALMCDSRYPGENNW